MSPADAKLRTGQPAEARTALAATPQFTVTDRGYNSDETLLIRQAQAGRWEAFAELTSHYDAPILALAVRLTGSQPDASELFQRVFSTAYRELRSYRFRCSFYLWIYRIVVRTSIEFLKQESRKVGPAVMPIDAALAQLSARERLVFELKHNFGLKLETIAAILETSEAIARNTFLRAVMMLRLGQSSG